MVKFYRKRNGFTLFELTFVFAIILVLCEMSVPANRYGSQNPRQKTCFSNLRNLLGAIEMYNMDHSDKIKELNNEVIELLIKKRVFKRKFIRFCMS